MPKRIHGEGPIPCDFMFVGEGPGWQEDKAGRPFVGKIGQELNRFLDGNRLPLREGVFVTNIYREFGGQKYVYTTGDLARDEPELLEELQRVQPEMIIPLGRHATRYFMGDVSMDDVQGIPYILPRQDKWSFLGADTVVFPITHPAAGFHNPEMSPYVVSGFTELGNYLAGVGEARILFDDPYPEPRYSEITTVEQLQRALGSLDLSRPVAIDTEGSPARPWSIQFSTDPGTGFLIRANNHQVLREFGLSLRRGGISLVYHSALHDLVMLGAMGLPTDMPFDDTMVMAYLLQIEPQGLKALCVRHCNMAMQSYDDVLGDASQRLALDYMQALWDVEQEDYAKKCQDKFWEEIDSGRRLSKIPQLPKSPLHKATERVLRSKDARKLWGNQVEDIQVAGYNRLGPLPEATLDHVPLATAIRYGCRDSDGTVRVRDSLGPRIRAMGLEDVYKLELGTYPLIARMTHVGIRPDLQHFASLSTKLAGELATLQAGLSTSTGDPTFNANSGDQVADYLFDGMGLEGGKKVESGRFSTNDKILEALEHEHPEVPAITTIRKYREFYKLKNTFVDRIPDFVHRWPRDGRIHATFRTTRVVTGRLASSDPNLLAQPKHGTFAKDFRRGWIADEGHVLAEWDFSQAELRVLAHLSQDPVMLATFRGERRNPDGSVIDLHAALAERIFGVKPKDQDKSKHRLPAKAINFGLPMGMTYKGLAVELRKNKLNTSEDDAQRWIDETMALYKNVPIYQERMVAEATRAGYIRCLSGRVRYIGGIRSRDERIQAEAKRFAFSTPIQEGAQFIAKQAEVRIWNEVLPHFWKQKKWIEPLIQIHDALTFEMEQGLEQEAHKLISEAMINIPKPLCVAMEVEGDAGLNWADMEKL